MLLCHHKIERKVFINSHSYIISLIFILLTSVLLAQDDFDCIDCHSGINIENSIHEDFDCIDCHTGIAELDIEHIEEFEIPDDDYNEICSMCHDDIYDEYLESIHGQSLFKTGSDEEAAHCYSCHGSHQILPSDDPDSKVYPNNLAETCGDCHAKPELVAKYNIPDIHPVELFSKSYHAKQLREEESPIAATCNDCHGVHDIKINTDPTSSISHSNIAKTCGVCHQEIFAEYSNSIHWFALARGQRESPTCIDCHGEHEIIHPADPNSPVSKRSAAEETCARCHTNEQLIRKYGLMEGKVSSYQDSYHGLAVLRGDKDAATCYDCHEPHRILKVDNVLSSIHPANLKNTCSKCHPGATDNFAQSYTHQSVILAEKPVEFYVRYIYLIIIYVTIIGMLIHNFLIFIRRIVSKYRQSKRSDYIQRYTKSQVAQHLVLLISFITLVITGFALKFSESYWVQVLASIGLNEMWRGLIHRIAGIALIGVSVWHIIEALTSRGGRDLVLAFIPNKRDFRSLVTNLKYITGISRERPRYDRFDYTEKIEYFGLIWGTVVMIITGLILFFPVFFTQNAPPWLIKVSEAVHYWEAWLASLTILVWHFFFVLFHPDEYPMSMTWINGKMNIEEYQHRHPLDYERIMKQIEDYKAGKINFKKLRFQAREYVIRHQIETQN